MRSYLPSGGGTILEQPMLPTQPPANNGAPSSKRKTPEDGETFGRSNKKAKGDVSHISFFAVCLFKASVDFDTPERIC